MFKLIHDFFQDETGAAAAEYAMVISIVGAGIAVAALALGTSITTAIGQTGTCMTTKGASC